MPKKVFPMGMRKILPISAFGFSVIVRHYKKANPKSKSHYECKSAKKYETFAFENNR